MTKLNLVFAVILVIFICFIYEQNLKKMNFDLKVKNKISSHPAATGIEFSGQIIQTFQRRNSPNKKRPFKNNPNIFKDQVIKNLSRFRNPKFVPTKT
jgi:hypothetical protein